MQKIVLGLVLIAAAAEAQANHLATQPALRTMHFSGYAWEVRPAEIGGPGPNHWDVSNIRVDAN